MIRTDKTLTMCRFAVGIMLSLLILSANINAYALNYNLVENEYNGWMETDDIFLYNDNYVSGSLKKIIDNENGCIYIYFQLYDSRLENTSLDNAVISFDIMNESHEYHFSVNHNGFIDTNTNEKKAIELAQNLELNSSFFTGFIGFELKNEQDRKSDSIIKCSYTCGHSEAFTLFENVPLYMYQEPEITTIKGTKEKTTKTKNGSNSNNRNSKNTTVKNKATTEHSKKASSTKFSGKGKFSAGEKAQSSIKNGTAKDTTKTASNEEFISSNESGHTEMSASAKAVLIAAVLIAIIGIIFIIIAAASKSDKKQSSDNDDDNHTDIDKE